MGHKTAETKQVCLRIPIGLHSRLMTYSKANSESFTSSCLRLLENGLKQEIEPVATKKDVQEAVKSDERNVKQIVKEYLTQERTTTQLSLETVNAKVEALEANQRAMTTQILRAIEEKPVQVLPPARKPFLERLRGRKKV